MQQALTFTLLLFASGCYKMPLTLAPSSVPLPDSYAITGPAYAEQCHVLFLGIPLDRGYSMSELVTAAQSEANADALINIFVDTSYRLKCLGLVTSTCHELTAVGVTFPGGVSTAQALPTQPAVSVPAALSTMPADSPQLSEVTPAAQVLAGELLVSLGRTPDAASTSSAAEVVQGFLNEGSSHEDLTAALERGVATLGDEQDLLVLLGVGLASQ